MRKLRCFLLLAFVVNNAYPQARIHKFNDSLSNNVILLEKVQDTIICIRYKGGGFEWNIFDTSLNLMSKQFIANNTDPFVLRQQLKTMDDGIVYIKQRVLKNSFDIGVKKLSNLGTDTIIMGTIIHSENISQNVYPSSLLYSSSLSASKKYMLLARLERRLIDKDSISIRIIVLDNSLQLLADDIISVPIQSETQMLMSVLVTDNGNVECITGDKFSSYVLGTQLNFYSYETTSGKLVAHAVKMQKHKLGDILIDSRDKKIFDLYSTYAVNTNTRKRGPVEGMININIDKQNYTTQTSVLPFDSDLKNEIARILNVQRNSVFDNFTWETTRFSDSANFVVASMRNPFGSTITRYGRVTQAVRTETPPVLMNPITKTKTLLFTQEQLYPSPITISNNTSGTSNLLIDSKFNRDPLLEVRKSYREVFVLFYKDDKNEFTGVPVSDKKLYEGLVFPKWIFEDHRKPKIAYSIREKGKYYIAISEIEKNGLSGVEIVPSSAGFFIDEFVPPVQLKNKIVFMVKNVITNESRLVMSQ